MTKKQVSEILKEHNERIVNYYHNKEEKIMLIDTTDGSTLSHFYINYKMRFATWQMYSICMVHDEHDATYWFFNN